MEPIILPPPEIIKEIIRFSTFPATQIHYLALCLVCKEWNEYVQFLISEKHRIDLPELAKTWAVQDLIHLFQCAINKPIIDIREAPRVGFVLNHKGLFHEYYIVCKTRRVKKIQMLRGSIWDEPTEFYKLRTELCPDDSNALYETEVIEWLKTWLPKFIFQYDNSGFYCDNYKEIEPEIANIYHKYITKDYYNEHNSCVEFLNIIKATSLHKFRKLLFQ